MRQMLVLHRLDEDAVHMALDEWWASVALNAFTPDDGGGYFAFEDTRTDIPVMFDKEAYDRQIANVPAESRPTHVAWYGK